MSANRVAAINPPIHVTDPIRKFSIDPGMSHRLAKTSGILSKRGADTDFQYRPHIVDTDTDCGRHFCGRHFRDSYKRKRTQRNARKCRQMQISGSLKWDQKRGQTHTNASKRRQTRANAKSKNYTPFYAPPFATAQSKFELPYTGVPRPSDPKTPKKSQKGLPVPPRPECQKVSKKSPKHSFFDSFLALFRVFWDLFDTFLALQAGRPRKTLLRLLVGVFGVRGPQDSCLRLYGGSNRKSKSCDSAVLA